MSKLLTITIPTYNAEKYLSTCLDSLCIPEVLDQLDIIVVNDGSKDSSAQIAERYVNRYPDSFRLINKENGGHGSGINAGIREARGSYFKVLDADDWFEKDGLIELVSFLGRASGTDPASDTSSGLTSGASSAPASDTALGPTPGTASDLASDTASCPAGSSAKESVSEKGPVSKHTPDLVSSQFLWVLDNGTGDVGSFPRKAQFEEPFPSVEYQKVYPLTEVAEKIYVKFHNLTVRTALLRENIVQMDEHCYYEDAEYALYPFAYAKTIAFTEKPVYMYRIGVKGQSMSREKLLKNVKNYDLVLNSLLSFTKAQKLSPEVKDYFERFLARFYAGRIKIALNMPVGTESKKAITELERSLKKDYPEVYQKNINTPLKLLRSSDYLLYLPAALLVRIRGTI